MHGEQSAVVLDTLPERPDPLAGTSYRAVALLAESAMGMVVEAEHRALGARVVVKLLHPTLVAEPDFADRMRVEAQVLAALAWKKSPHLVTVSDFAATPAGCPFLVMERLHGHSVAREIELRGALPVDEAIGIALQTLTGLAVVHDAGIVHRDIKPANLFLCLPENGVRLVKLLDFGLAKVLASAPRGRAPTPLRFPTGEGVALGTPRWLSPEQARGAPVDARTDIYAVGALLYALLTGNGPFDHVRGTAELFHAHATIVPPPPSVRAAQTIPAMLDAIVMRALAKRPEDRFATAVDFSAALVRILEGPHPDNTTLPGVVNRVPVLPWAARRFDTVPLSPGASPAILPLSPRGAPERAEAIPPLAAHPHPEPERTSPRRVPHPPTSSAETTAIVPRTQAASGFGISIAVLVLSALVSATLLGLIARALLFR